MAALNQMQLSQNLLIKSNHGESSAICPETEGKLVLKGTTPHNETVFSTKSPLPPSVIGVPLLSPQRRDLSRISAIEELFENGYDSDGLKGPFFDAIEEEGEQDFDEDSLDSKPHTAEIEEEEGGNTSNTSDQVVLTKNIVMNMGVKMLKDELKKRQLKVGGNKKSLQERLLTALESNVPTGKQITVQEKCKSKEKEEIPVGFPSTVYWKLLNHESECVDEPSNPTFKAPRAPTHPDRDALKVPMKYNFAETFDRPVWQGRMESPMTFASGIEKKNIDGSKMMENVTRKYGCLDPRFIKKHNLSVDSQPEDFMETLFPFEENPYNTASKKYLSFKQITQWTNLKATLAGAGPDGTSYKNFRPFSVKEVRQHIGLYIFNGLNPSPRVELKFRSHEDDVVHGNNFIYRSFGPAAAMRHKEFKAFLAYQDPAIDIPSKSKFPNWKVRPLLTWMNYIFPQVWNLGQEISIDEMTIGFQGRHVDKRRITYKRAGDGFQCDALCESGFTYQFYFRNHPAPLKYLKMKLSPLHSRVMALFDSLHDRNHICGMDNLYNSATFCRAAYTHKKRVMVHGVTRKGMRGLPKCVIQQEVLNRKRQLQVRGTVKAAVLLGDPQCPNLVASSIYDTKPVHFLSMVCTEVKWVLKLKKVYNVDTGQIESLKYLRMNNIDHYNYSMGHVDLSDQLRDQYRMNYWLRNRKWWWSLMMWGLGVQITNAYVMYKTLNLQAGRAKKDLISHHDFRKRIALYWINPEECINGVKRSLFSISSDSRKRRMTKSDTATSVSSISTISTSTTQMNKKSRACVINDKSLHHSSSLSKTRLNRSLDHIADIGRPSARCALHRWLGFETEKNVHYCSSCNVNLCVPCNRVFHTVPDILDIRFTLFNRYRKKLN